MKRWVFAPGILSLPWVWGPVGAGLGSSWRCAGDGSGLGPGPPSSRGKPALDQQQLLQQRVNSREHSGAQRHFPGPRGLVLVTPPCDVRGQRKAAEIGAPGGECLLCVTRDQSCPLLLCPKSVFFSRF